MKNIIWIAGILGVMLAVTALSAQTRPDFTGTWVVERVEQPERPGGEWTRGPGGGMGGRGGGMRGGAGGERPGGGMRSVPFARWEKGQRVRLKQTADRLIVTTAGEGDEQMSSYALDGSESTNLVGRGATKSKTAWEGYCPCHRELSSDRRADGSGDVEDARGAQLERGPPDDDPSHDR